MEFTIEKNELLKELNLVQGVVEKKNTIPILSNLLIKSDGTGRIAILGTDLDVSLRTGAPASVKTEGSMVVSARKLFYIVRNLPEAPIRLTQDSNQWIVIDCARSKFKVVGQGKEHFPVVPLKKGISTYSKIELTDLLGNKTASVINTFIISNSDRGFF